MICTRINNGININKGVTELFYIAMLNLVALFASSVIYADAFTGGRVNHDPLAK